MHNLFMTFDLHDPFFSNVIVLVMQAQAKYTVESGYLAHALIGITAKLYAPHSEVR